MFPVEDKARIVLSVLAGETTVAEAARKAKVSEQSVGNWKRQFLEAGEHGDEDDHDGGGDRVLDPTCVVRPPLQGGLIPAVHARAATGR